MKKTYKILAVDDVEDWLIFYNKLLFKMSDSVEFKYSFEKCAKDGLDNALKHRNYDLIISDLEMEDIAENCPAGEWFLSNLVALDDFKKTKFIIISARYNIEQIANKLGVDYIPKSLLLNSPLTFSYKIRELLDLD